MAKRRPDILKSAALAAFLATAPAALLAVLPPPAHAASGLPAPHVSRALDAVLLPVDPAVTAAFGLAPGARGVLVLATQPGGLADASGILPGDVLDYVRGTEILSPRDLDAIVYEWLMQGISDFVFDGARAGAPFASETVITLEYWEETIEITEISSWESYSSESFSYEEYTSEYSEEISASYEESSSEFEASEETTEAEAEAEAEAGAEAEETTADADCMGEVIDGVCADDDMPAEEDPVEEEAYDEPVEEEAYDEPVDDGGDVGGDEGGDDGGGEEELVE